MQLSGPLFHIGTVFRMVDQSGVDVEDLYHMLKQIPQVQEKKNALDFVFKNGEIEFKNLGYTHYVTDRPKAQNGKNKSNKKDNSDVKTHE